MGCYYHFHSCREGSLLQHELEDAIKRREKKTEHRRQYLEKLNLRIVEVWECQWQEWTKTNKYEAKNFRTVHFPYIPLLSCDKLPQNIFNGELFGVVDCQLEVPLHLRAKFEKFPPVFRNRDASINDIGDHMTTFAREHKLLQKPRKMLISSMILEGGPIITRF